MKYKDKLVIIELLYPGSVVLCIMKIISPEIDRSFVVNLEFRDNPKKWHVWFIYIFIYIYSYIFLHIAFWQSSAPCPLSTLVISVLLYSLTRDRLISPGKDKTCVCGYIYIYIYIYIYYIYIHYICISITE